MDAEIETKLDEGLPLTPQEVCQLTVQELEVELGYNFEPTEGDRAAIAEAAQLETVQVLEPK